MSGEVYSCKSGADWRTAKVPGRRGHPAVGIRFGNCHFDAPTLVRIG
jgi:hypothetical protein